MMWSINRSSASGMPLLPKLPGLANYTAHGIIGNNQPHDASEFRKTAALGW
jgi:hypothetical protein